MNSTNSMNSMNSMNSKNSIIIRYLIILLLINLMMLSCLRYNSSAQLELQNVNIEYRKCKISESTYVEKISKMRALQVDYQNIIILYPSEEVAEIAQIMIDSLNCTITYEQVLRIWTNFDKDLSFLNSPFLIDSIEIYLDCVDWGNDVKGDGIREEVECLLEKAYYSIMEYKHQKYFLIQNFPKTLNEYHYHINIFEQIYNTYPLFYGGQEAKIEAEILYNQALPLILQEGSNKYHQLVGEYNHNPPQNLLEIENYIFTFQELQLNYKHPLLEKQILSYIDKLEKQKKNIIIIQVDKEFDAIYIKYKEHKKTSDMLREYMSELVHLLNKYPNNPRENIIFEEIERLNDIANKLEIEAYNEKRKKADYIGDRETHIVHKRDCPIAQQISIEKRTYFWQLQEARKRRYRMCRHCLGY